MNTKTVTSQYGGYVNPGANPVPGVTANLPLNNSAGAGSEDGVTLDKVRELMQKIMSSIGNKREISSLVPVVQTMSQNIQDENLANMFASLVQTMQFNNSTQTRPINQALSPANPSQVVQNINDYVEKMEQFNNKTSSSNNKLKQTAQIIKKKKKTRGNPFKVLMGKAGKLLDHGLNKNQIVNYLAKQKYWNKETIEKAVDIVKDYNRKKHKKAVYDLKRLILAEAKEVNEILNNYEMLSTADLLMRKSFLQSCIDGIDLGFVPKSPKKEIGIINSILEERSELF